MRHGRDRHGALLGTHVALLARDTVALMCWSTMPASCSWLRILSSHNQTTRGPKCKGMEGLVKEGAELIAEEADDEVRDAGLISAAQRVEHYEMAVRVCSNLRPRI